MPLARWGAAILLGAVVSAMVLPTAALGQVPPGACGNPFANHYGPFDYRTASATVRKIVEEVHFTVGIETITRPKNTMFHEMAQDVEYTLNVFPNHARALLTMSRLADRWKRDPPPGTKLPVECWFDRAVRFRPDDTVVRSLYAQFLHRRKRTQEGVNQLIQASEHAGENALSHYNIGLVFFELGAHDQALKSAHRATALGFPRPELGNMLKAANQWREPDLAAAAAASPLERHASEPTKASQ